MADEKFVRGARVKPKPSAPVVAPVVPAVVAAPVVEAAAELTDVGKVPSKRSQRKAQGTESRDMWYRQHEAGVSRSHFWIVWSPTERRPTMRHESAARALEAAQRLSRAHPDREFLTFECTLIGGEGPR